MTDFQPIQLPTIAERKALCKQREELDNPALKESLHDLDFMHENRQVTQFLYQAFLAYREMRKWDGMSGRNWDAVKHLEAEDKIVLIEKAWDDWNNEAPTK